MSSPGSIGGAALAAGNKQARTAGFVSLRASAATDPVWSIKQEIIWGYGLR